VATNEWYEWQNDESSETPPNVWHQRRAQRVRCMPGLGPRRIDCGGVRYRCEAANPGAAGEPVEGPSWARTTLTVRTPD
jgi:hypothetical protein